FNVFLVKLCTISTIFATFLVRSGIVDSVHAFGQSSVGTPLLLGVLILGVISLLLTFAKAKNNQPLPELLSREGLLLVMTWFLLAIAFIILIATLWPVLTKLVSKTPAGLDAAFYNRVCLPLAALLLLLLAFGPWLGAKETAKKTLLPLSGCLLLSLAGLYFFGYTNPVAALAAASGLTIILGIFLALLKNPKGLLFTLKSLGAHLGLALIAIGIAFSGPYSKEEDLELAKGETGQIGDYQVTLEDLIQGQGLGYSSLETPLKVERQGEIFGHLMPERRIYDKFGEMQFSEVDTIPSLGNEIYASLLGLNGKKAVVRVSVKPLVNWLWIGGFLMCLLPLLPRKKTSLNSAKAQEQEVQPKHEA
ncbi:MAG: heme lyase CcmF/NrfE family subunit, partial [Desulfovibrio sp.]|nr:heme lyase CcmF/NrfE family subunit [Desulfovibrio sp.]